MTAWTWALKPVRRLDSLSRKRTISRSSRISGGAIHASARRPRRNKSARSRASRSSFHPAMSPVVAVRVGEVDE